MTQLWQVWEQSAIVQKCSLLVDAQTSMRPYGKCKTSPVWSAAKCPDCPSTEIIVKEIDLDGTSYEGYFTLWS